MTDFQGALGVTQSGKLESIILARRERAAYYDSLLKNTSITAPLIHADARSVYQSYVVLLPDKMIGKRNELILQLKPSAPR